MARLFESRFHRWYQPGGIGSGKGADVEYTEEFRGWLEAFMDEHKIKTVLDYGCGDFKWARYVQWGDRQYLGVDIVPAAIEVPERKKLATDSIRFQLIEDPDAWQPEGKYDLVLCKDVLQHVPLVEATDIARKLLAAGDHVLFIGDRPHVRSPGNAEVERGGYRGLDMSKSPFALGGEEPFVFERSRAFPEHKVVFWARGGPEGTKVMDPPESKGVRSIRGRGGNSGAPSRHGMGRPS